LISKIENILAFRYLKPKKKEGFLKVISIFSFTGISLGVAILIIVMSVMNGFRSELIDKILGFNPHIIVKPYNKEIDNKKVKKLNSLSEYIVSSTFSYNGEGIVISKNNTQGILVRGYLKKDLIKINQLQEGIIDGSLENLENNTVSIGKDLAISLDLVAGEKINLMSASSVQTIFGELPIQQTFLISSIFTSGLAEFDQNVIFMNIDDALILFDGSKKDILLEIFLKDPENVVFLKERIQNIFSDQYVYSWADLNKSFFAALKVERNVMFIILTLIIIVAAFNIISGLTILVKNKTKEIAILRTLGISKKSIVKIFFLTGFTIGFLATLTGVIIGILFSTYIEEIRILITTLFGVSLFPEEIYFLSKMPSEINFTSILIISFFSLFITIIATIFPSMAAARLDPVKALKYE
jgi:lipoprotein-releasing system permease protein